MVRSSMSSSPGISGRCAHGRGKRNKSPGWITGAWYTVSSPRRDRRTLWNRAASSTRSGPKGSIISRSSVRSSASSPSHSSVRRVVPICKPMRTMSRSSRFSAMSIRARKQKSSSSWSSSSPTGSGGNGAKPQRALFSARSTKISIPTPSRRSWNSRNWTKKCLRRFGEWIRFVWVSMYKTHPSFRTCFGIFHIHLP